MSESDVSYFQQCGFFQTEHRANRPAPKLPPQKSVMVKTPEPPPNFPDPYIPPAPLAPRRWLGKSISIAELGEFCERHGLRFVGWDLAKGVGYFEEVRP